MEQLFSIGVHLLHNNGTVVLENGDPILTYTNQQVSEYARVWTGFERQDVRGNIEAPWDGKLPTMITRVLTAV